jgi:hypothetical protein
MFKAIVTASVSVLLLTLASAASACADESDPVTGKCDKPSIATIKSCEQTAATNYAIALEIGAPDADMVVEDTMADCGADYATLNELVAVDGEAWLPVCQFHGDCAARQADTMLAPVLAMLSN